MHKKVFKVLKLDTVRKQKQKRPSFLHPWYSTFGGNWHKETMKKSCKGGKKYIKLSEHIAVCSLSLTSLFLFLFFQPWHLASSDVTKVPWRIDSGCGNQHRSRAAIRHSERSSCAGQGPSVWPSHQRPDLSWTPRPCPFHGQQDCQVVGQTHGEVLGPEDYFFPGIDYQQETQ